MACEMNREALAAYLDGELPSAEAGSVEQHVRACPGCAAEVAERMYLRRTLAAARGHYVPDPEWKKRMLAKTTSRPQSRPRWFAWAPAAIAAAAAVLLFAGFWMERHSSREQAFREVADLHVSDLASDHPVDVVSTDRHTVKPWFAGRIPFSFNVPEFTGSDFTLIGGRVAYLQQEPGAQLLVGLHQHKISVLIVRESSELAQVLPDDGGVHAQASFHVDTWQAGGLRYIVVGDADAAEIGNLARLFRQANP